MQKRYALVLSCALMLSGPAAFAQAFPMTIPTDPASRQISVVVDKGLTHTRQLPRRSLRDARKAMIAKQVVSDDDLRALAEYGDGLAAKKYVDLVLGREGLTKDNASDVAYFASIAAQQGRVYALDEMVSAMMYLDPESEPQVRKRQLIKVLYPYAWEGNSLAMDAVIDYNGEGKLFGALSERTRQRILDHAENSDGRVELRFALQILTSDQITQADLDRATAYLERAERSRTLAVVTTAANLKTLLSTKQTQMAPATN